MGKRFAIKVLFGHLALSEQAIARFNREARAASQFNHINIVNITDFSVTETGLPFLVMDVLSGRSLTQVIAKEGPLSPARTVHIGKQIALALAHAHDKGILHRDLKPENVMLQDREEGGDFVTVLDFGLAGLLGPAHDEPKLTLQGTVAGTPEFMSPEQAQGLELSPSSDLYSLGVILYLMLSRALPFARPKVREHMLYLHITEPPRPLSKLVLIREPIEHVVMRLLEKLPGDRYANGREVANALDDALEASVQQNITNPLAGPEFSEEDLFFTPMVAQVLPRNEEPDTLQMPALNTPVDQFGVTFVDPTPQQNNDPISVAATLITNAPAILSGVTQPLAKARLAELLSLQGSLSAPAKKDKPTLPDWFVWLVVMVGGVGLGFFLYWALTDRA